MFVCCKQKTAYEVRISDWSSDVCSSDLMEDVQLAYESTTRTFSTPELNRILGEAVEAQPPPAVLGRRIKLRYAHQAGSNPPRIMVHGNQTDRLPDHYKRSLDRKSVV